MIYIASKTKHAKRWIEYRDKGYPIISTWIDEAEKGASKSMSDLWCRCVEESSRADILIAYAEPGEILKGALVEIGASLASGKRVLAVGLDQSMTVLNHPQVLRVADIDNAFKFALDIINSSQLGRRIEC